MGASIPSLDTFTYGTLNLLVEVLLLVLAISDLLHTFSYDSVLISFVNYYNYQYNIILWSHITVDIEENAIEITFPN